MTEKLRILALLQNQWFPGKSAERVRQIMATHDLRGQTDLVGRYLFLGPCWTAQRLLAAFGEDSREWDHQNASPEIGDHASAKFKPDLEHIQRVIELCRPSVILAFGRAATIACQALHDPRKLLFGKEDWRLICGPHPAARGPDVMAQLRRMAEELRQIRNEPQPVQATEAKP